MADPRVLLDITPAVISNGGQATITLTTSDDVGVTLEELTVDGVPVPLTSGVAVYTATLIGMLDVVGYAEDAAGNMGEALGTLVVVDPADTTPPTVSIALPLDGDTIGETSDVIGSVADGSGLVDYTVRISSAGLDQWTVLANDAGPVTNDILAELQPASFFDGWYDLQLEAVDGGGNLITETITVEIDSGVKPGAFTVEFVDLVVPVSGIPIRVTRAYDSRERNQVSDFGYGWRVDTSSVRVSKNVREGDGQCWSNVQVSSQWGIPDYQLQATRDPQVHVDFGAALPHEFDFGLSPDTQTLYPWGPFYPTSPTYSNANNTNSDLTQGTGEFTQVEYDGNCFLNDDFISAIVYDPLRYELTLEDGTWVDLSSEDGLLELIDPSGNQVVFDALGITHSAGVSVSYTRDAQDRITDITDPDGDTLSYAYDAAGNLASVTDRNGNTTTFTYTADHYLQDVFDPTGARVIRNYYDVDGRLVQQCDSLGNCVQMLHDIASNQEVRTDRLGSISVLTYDGEGNLIEEVDRLGRSTTYGYDAAGNLVIESTPGGGTTTHTYTSDRRRLSTTDPLGNTESWTYDSSGRVLTHTDTLGNLTTKTYDSAGRLVAETDRLGNQSTMSYNGAGNLVGRTDRAGGSWTWAYDGAGRKTSETDPLGNARSWTYDANGRTLTETTPAGVTSYGYDGEGNLTSITNPDGGVETIVYDGAGRESQRIDPLGNTTTKSYDLNGNHVQTVWADGAVETWTYDAEDRLVGTTDGEGNATSYVLDAEGQKVTELYGDGGVVQLTYDLAGNVIAETDPEGGVTAHTFDLMGRALSRTDPLGNTWTFTYDAAGQRTSATDPAGTVTEWVYDAEGRTVETILASGLTEEIAISKTFDGEGRVLSQTDPMGNSWTYTYDGKGQLLTVDGPEGLASSYTYDAAGHPLTMTDALGRTTSIAYDAMGRRTSRTTPTGRVTSWAYDVAGRLLSQTDAAGDVTTYTYDARARVLTAVFADGTVVETSYLDNGWRAGMAEDGAWTTFGYDTEGRVTSRANPDGSTVAYGYDLAGRTTSVVGTAGAASHDLAFTHDLGGRLATVTDTAGRTVTYGYDAQGNRTSETRSTGASSAWSYDALNRLLEVSHLDNTGVLMEQFTYTLDGNGNRVQLDELDGSQVLWGYDALSRLVSETRTGTGPYTGTWTYDAVSNRVAQTVGGASATLTYDDDDRLVTADGRTYTYDALGRMTSVTDGAQVDDYFWSATGRLSSVERNAVPLVTYTYDPDGNRTSRDDGSAVRRYLVDAESQTNSMVLLETDGSGTQIAEYTYGDGLIAQDRGGERWYVKDGLGSVRGLMDATGTMTDSYAYTAWGEGLVQIGSTSNDYQYAGEQIDPLTNSYYLRARYMDPTTGRFLSEDPFAGTLRDPMTLHRYLYTPDNPVNFTDASGEFWAAVGGFMLRAAFSLTFQTFRIRYVLQMLKVAIISVMAIRYLIGPGRELAIMGALVGGRIGQALGEMGISMISYGGQTIAKAYGMAWIRAGAPIVGYLMMAYKAWKNRDAIFWLIQHADLVYDVGSFMWGYRPSLSCLWDLFRIEPTTILASVNAFALDVRTGNEASGSFKNAAVTMIPVYQALKGCAQSMAN